MNTQTLEKLFQKAWTTLDKKKLILAFFTLCFCGLLVVFSRVLAIGSGQWVALSLSFLPVFASSSLLFALGILLVKMYVNEANGGNISFSQLMIQAWKPIVSICYITLPLFLVYLCAWLVLGIFFLLKAIPGIGDIVGVFLSFGPFILILTSLFLVFLNVAILFFMAPSIALKEHLDIKLWKEVGLKLKKHVFANLAFLTIASMPILFILSFLIGAAYLTKLSYFSSTNPLFVGLSWFFLMLPFNALLTPFIVFFFNFATETHFFLNELPQEDKLVKNPVNSV